MKKLAIILAFSLILAVIFCCVGCEDNEVTLTPMPTPTVQATQTSSLTTAETTNTSGHKETDSSLEDPQSSEGEQTSKNIVTPTPMAIANEIPSSTTIVEPTPLPIPTETTLYLEISQPLTGTQISTSPILMSGQTIPEAVVSILIDYEIEIADMDENGYFEVIVDLEEGPNLVEVIASDQFGNEKYMIILVDYLP